MFVLSSRVALDCCPTLLVQVLHEGRVQQTRREDPDTYAWLECLRSQNLLYVTPKNMNDDMFWMYAPIRGRAGSRLVSTGIQRHLD